MAYDIASLRSVITVPPPEGSQASCVFVSVVVHIHGCKSDKETVDPATVLAATKAIAAVERAVKRAQAKYGK